MLDFDIHAPVAVADGARVIVLLHGRGADEGDMLRLGPHLDPAVVVAPRAPFEAAPWGYGPGWAWYRYIGGTRPEPESFSTSQQALGDFLHRLPGELAFRPGEIVLGGFSQGGTMSLGFAISRPGVVGRVINFSGFLADHPEVRVTRAAADGLRVFWGHGTADPNIPYEFAVEGRKILYEAGADLTTGDYPIGHWIAPDELEDLRRWLQEPSRGE
jgi:phospholipase/carboxylesterase